MVDKANAELMCNSGEDTKICLEVKKILWLEQKKEKIAVNVITFACQSSHPL